jgi:antitoxin (DNA-binding transcriptional repressor) of toxin-antitoxin stability system
VIKGGRMTLVVNITEVLKNFSDYINRVVYRRERFILLRGGKPVAELSPVPSGTRLRELPALLASLPRLSEEEADAFLEDLARARAELGAAPDRDPWDS